MEGMESLTISPSGQRRNLLPLLRCDYTDVDGQQNILGTHLLPA